MTSDVLLADIGGTHVRFEIPGAPYFKRAIAEFPTLADAVKLYVSDKPKPARGLFAVNGPVAADGRSATGTNGHWTFDSAAVLKDTGIDVRFVNDFVAKASAVASLPDDGMVKLGGGDPLPGAPVGVIGPGTGLGVGYGVGTVVLQCGPAHRVREIGIGVVPVVAGSKSRPSLLHVERTHRGRHGTALIFEGAHIHQSVHQT